jgi:putative effector of murein hydrolase LrgA (UPF0299 family)
MLGLLYLSGWAGIPEDLAVGLAVLLVFTGVSVWVVSRVHRRRPDLRELRGKWAIWIHILFWVEMALAAVFLVVASFGVVIYYAFSLDRTFRWWLFIGFILLSLALLVWAIRQWAVRSATSFAIPFLIPLLVPIQIAVMNSLPGPLDRLIEPDVVGIVRASSRPTTGQIKVELESGHVIGFPESTAALNIRGITAEQMILFGEDYGRAWYATLRLDELSPVEGCYDIDGVALDQPDAVIILHPGDWHGVGLRLPKRDDFRLPDDVFVDSNGLYYMLGEYPHGSFCVDTSGSVFSVPFP